MRKSYLLGGLVVLGLFALTGWATLGKAEPGSPVPVGKPSVGKQIIERVPVQPVDDDSNGIEPGKPGPVVKAVPTMPPLIVDPVEELPVRVAADPLKLPSPTARPKEPTAEPEELHNAGRIRWVSGRPSEAPAYAGTDFIIVRNGRIAAVYLFFDKLP